VKILTEFKPVSWQPNQLIEKVQMDQMSANDQYLYDNMPKMVYKNPTRTETALKILAGVSTGLGPIAAQGAGVDVNYQGEFATGCFPVVTTGAIVLGSNECIGTATIYQIPTDSKMSLRFEIRQAVKANQRIKSAVYIHWMAMGYFSNATA
jgi:hypothetical protein